MDVPKGLMTAAGGACLLIGTCPCLLAGKVCPGSVVKIIQKGLAYLRFPAGSFSTAPSRLGGIA